VAPDLPPAASPASIHVPSAAGRATRPRARAPTPRPRRRCHRSRSSS